MTTSSGIVILLSHLTLTSILPEAETRRLRKLVQGYAGYCLGTWGSIPPGTPQEENAPQNCHTAGAFMHQLPSLTGPAQQGMACDRAAAGPPWEQAVVCRAFQGVL